MDQYQYKAQQLTVMFCIHCGLELIRMLAIATSDSYSYGTAQF